jgi:hypothetical protein
VLAVITATDTYSNVVTNFDASANNVTAAFLGPTPACGTLTPMIAGLGNSSNAVLNRNTDFFNGGANLIGGSPANAMKVLTGCAGNYRFRFTSGAATGDSATIVFNNPP